MRLTKKTAAAIVSRIIPAPKISKDATPPEVQIFRAFTGPDGLEIRCENDWMNHNGRIRLTVLDNSGGGCITQYYDPDTLARDCTTEDCTKLAEAKAERHAWLLSLGKKEAHLLVDRLYDGIEF